MVEGNVRIFTPTTSPPFAPIWRTTIGVKRSRACDRVSSGCCWATTAGWSGSDPMIKRATALVLGAGASAPFGFPSGRTLRDNIIRDLGTGSTDLYKALATSGFDARQI